MCEICNKHFENIKKLYPPNIDISTLPLINQEDIDTYFQNSNKIGKKLTNRDEEQDMFVWKGKPNQELTRKELLEIIQFLSNPMVKLYKLEKNKK